MPHLEKKRLFSDDELYHISYAQPILPPGGLPKTSWATIEEKQEDCAHNSPSIVIGDKKERRPSLSLSKPIGKRLNFRKWRDTEHHFFDTGFFEGDGDERPVETDDQTASKLGV